MSGHEWLLRELLSNLVDNAVKYSATGGTVTVRCDDELPAQAGGSQVFLEVEDDGSGIAALKRARVLERFYRVPGTAVENNGLGLAIADEIARGAQRAVVAGAGRFSRRRRLGLACAPDTGRLRLSAVGQSLLAAVRESKLTALF